MCVLVWILNVFVLTSLHSSATTEVKLEDLDLTFNISDEKFKHKRQTGDELCLLPKPMVNGLFYPHKRRCPPEDNSAACRLVPGERVNVGWVLRYGCYLGYGTNTSHIASICLNRKGYPGWFPALPRCVESKWHTSRLIPSRDICGKPARHLRTKRKVDGKISLLGAWPWMVIFGHNRTSEPSIHWFCAGTLVTTRHVLTAANCMSNHRRRPVFIARFGDLNLDDNGSDGAEPIDVEVDKRDIIIHPGFKPDTVFSNNVAVVRLKNDVTITDFVRPICLPTPDFLRRTFTDATTYLTSWGQTDDDEGPNRHRRKRYDPILHEVKGKVIDHGVCRFNYRLYQSSDTPIIISDKVICASIESNKSCQGDIGSPLMLSYKENFFMLGIVATDFRCFDKLFPRVFTQLASYMTWIVTNIQF